MENKKRTKLTSLRFAAGKSQADLANELKVSTQMIYGLERGTSNPRACNIPRIAKAYGITPQELVQIVFGF